MRFSPLLLVAVHKAIHSMGRLYRTRRTGYNVLMETILQILRDPLWVGLSAIATAIMAWFTYKSLRQYSSKERMVENRELLEKIIHPFFESISSLPNQIKGLTLSKPPWENLVKQNRYIAYKIPQSLEQEIERVLQEIESLQQQQDTALPKLWNIISVNLYPKLQHVMIGLPDSRFRNCAYSLKVKGEQHFIMFENLLFENRNLKPTIVALVEEAKDREYEGEIVIEEGLNFAGGIQKEITVDIFDDVLVAIQKSVAKDRMLTSYIDRLRKLTASVEQLTARVGEHRKSLAVA
jgi:hypothetical protein